MRSKTQLFVAKRWSRTKIKVRKGEKKYSRTKNDVGKGGKNCFHTKIDIRKGSARLRNTKFDIGSKRKNVPTRKITLERECEFSLKQKTI